MLCITIPPISDKHIVHAQPSWHSVPLTTPARGEMFCWAMHLGPLANKFSLLLSQTDTKTSLTLFYEELRSSSTNMPCFFPIQNTVLSNMQPQRKVSKCQVNMRAQTLYSCKNGNPGHRENRHPFINTGTPIY